MIEINDFYNRGFGWICKRCERDQNETGSDEMPRIWREGEAESKQPKLAAPIAKWLDAAHRQLICPQCGITELADKT